MTSPKRGDVWAPVRSALDRAAAQGRTVDIWVRDDDAIAPTTALGRLADLARRFDLPVLLAVIPEPAVEALARFVAEEPLFTPTQHGFSHTNHAAPGERACEIGGDRSLAAVFDDLRRGRAKMTALFGARCADVLVPPWNRIAPAVVAALPALGFGALSTFADAHAGAHGIAVHNCDLDIIDWRGGRRGHPVSKLAPRLAALIARDAPIGILTHHLAHDGAAWDFLDMAFALLRRHPAVRLLPLAALRPAASDAPSPPGCNPAKNR